MITYFKTISNCICKIDEFEAGCWVNVIAPTQDEITLLQNKFNIEPEHFLSSLDEEESSHIDIEDDYTFIIFDVPYAEKENNNLIYFTAPVGVVVTATNVITIAKTDNPVLMDFSKGVVKGVETSHKTEFVLTMFLRMATRFLAYLRQIDRYSSNLESKLRKSMNNKELVQLLDLQKSLVYFQSSLKYNDLTVMKISKGRVLKMYEDDEDLLEDVLIEIKQAIEMTNISSSVLANTMGALSSLISNNLNGVMKVLTSITILMSIPTMIFSFYGMNIGEGIGGALPFSGNMIFVCIFTVVVTIACGIILHWKKLL